MKVGVLKESAAGERRVALVPENAAHLVKKKIGVNVEAGAGTAAGHPDAMFYEKGADLASRREVFRTSDILLTANLTGRAADHLKSELHELREGQVLISCLDPLAHPEVADFLAATGVTAFALELLPRITRAQEMDVQSSMSSISGYKAVLLAADVLPRFFPMLMTAAGTIMPARVLVIGAGVAGLQAIATARRLGAVVQAYDVRPAVKEEVESLGAKFVDLPLETSRADSNGYARDMGEDFYARQREVTRSIMAKTDVVITKATVPGKKPPVLLSRELVEIMPPGSVIVDLVAEQGGNCEFTRVGETVIHRDVTILGPVNLPSQVPYHASQMFGNNMLHFILNIVKDGELHLDLDDDIVRDTLITHGGRVVHPRVRELLGQNEPAAV